LHRRSVSLTVDGSSTVGFADGGWFDGDRLIDPSSTKESSAHPLAPPEAIAGVARPFRGELEGNSV